VNLQVFGLVFESGLLQLKTVFTSDGLVFV